MTSRSTRRTPAGYSSWYGTLFGTRWLGDASGQRNCVSSMRCEWEVEAVGWMRVHGGGGGHHYQLYGAHMQGMGSIATLYRP